MRALLIDDRDSAAVVVEPVKRGDEVTYEMKDHRKRTVTASEDIPIFHKIAVTAVKKGQPVIKYGEHIGVAGCDIEPGCHVHVHNVENCREEL